MSAFQPRPAADIALDIATALQPSANGRHIVRHVDRSTPVFWLGDTAWELFHRLDDAEAGTFLRNRAAKGFNVIMIVVLAEHGAGEWPFLPAASSTADRYRPDIARPNPAYFDFVDRVVRLASELGMTVALVPTWGRYVNGGYYGDPILFDEANAYDYGRFLGERYPFHPFIVGGDSVRFWNSQVLATIGANGDVSKLEKIDYGAVTDAMAKGLVDGEKAAVAELEPGLKQQALGYEPLITFHSAQMWMPGAPEASSSAQFGDKSWLTLDCVQTGHHDEKSATEAAGGNAQAGYGAVNLWKCRSSYVPLRKMYAARRPDGQPRPVVDLEPHYENIHEWFNMDGPKWQARDIRNGACGYTYGCNSIWQMHNGASATHPPIAPPTTAYTDWMLELDLPGAFNASVARTIMQSLPNVLTRVPDQSFIQSSTNEPADATKLAGDKLVSGTRAEGWAMAHLPYGGSIKIAVERALPGSKSWRAWWIEPKTGGREVCAKGEVGVAEFTSPSEGSLDDDWILLLEAI